MQALAYKENAYTKAMVCLFHKSRKGLMGLLLITLFLLHNSLIAQQSNSDSLYTKNTVAGSVLDTAKSNHSPKTAGWMSAALPGLGQVYNKKYWKAPVIYVAFGTITYFLVTNNAEYQKYH